MFRNGLLVCLCVGMALAAAACAQALTCEEWAEKLAVYKANPTEGSKGYFGISREDVGELVKLKPDYDEAKALYTEFKKTGMDPDDCHQLRDAAWNIGVSIGNYEGSLERIIKGAEDELEIALQWLQSYPQNAWTYARDLMAGHRRRIGNAETLFGSDNPRVKALQEKFAGFEKRISEAQAKALEKVRMKPDAYKGGDANSLKALAKSIVMKAHPKAKILRVSITSKSWERESVIEFTDTTKTALQHRVTNGVYAQVAAKEDNECLIYTLYLHKDSIGGAQRELQGHIMYQDRILEKNVGQ